MSDSTPPTKPCDHDKDLSPVCMKGGVPCCWTEDVNKEITTAGDGSYFQKLDPSGNRVSVGPTARYRMHVHLSQSKIVVDMRLKLERQSGVSEAQANAAKPKLESGVTGNWGAAGHCIKVSDDKCGTKTLTVESSQFGSIPVNISPLSFTRQIHGKTLLEAQ